MWILSETALVLGAADAAGPLYDTLAPYAERWVQAGQACWPLLVHRAELSPGRHVVARDDQRVGRLLGVDLDLPQRALEQVLVLHPVGPVAVVQRLHRVDRVAGHERLALLQAQDHRGVPERVAGGEDHAHAAVAEDVDAASERRERVDVRALKIYRAEVERVV